MNWLWFKRLWPAFRRRERAERNAARRRRRGIARQKRTHPRYMNPGRHKGGLDAHK